MSETSSPRSLLMEQLESRCLLAGGLFSFSSGHDDRGEVRQSGSQTLDRPRPDRSAEVQGQGRLSGRHESDRMSLHRERSPLAHSERDRLSRPIPITSLVVHSPAIPDTDRSEPSGVLDAPINAPINDAPEPVPASGPSGSVVREPRVIQSGPGETAADPNNTVTDTPTRSNNAGPSGPLVRPPSEADTTLVVVVDSENHSGPEYVNAEASQPNESDEFRSSRIENAVSVATRPTIPPPSVFDDQNVNPGGVIQTLSPDVGEPLRRTRPLALNESSADDPWELEHETIRDLRDIADHPAEQSAQQQRDSMDHAIADWFGGRGGLIEIESCGGTLLMDDPATSIVEIALDAILGSHRSLDLFATADSSESEMLVRDAILAAIAGEQATHASPLHEPSNTRLPSFAYSGAALIASTLAIVSRRKQGNALSKTSGGGRSQQV